MLNWITSKVKKYYENYVEDSNYYSWCKEITDRLTALSDLLSIESHSDRPGTINEEINKSIYEINLLLKGCSHVSPHKVKTYSHSTRSEIIKNVPIVLLNAVNFITGHLSTTKCTEKQTHILHILIVSAISRPEFDFDPNEKEDVFYKSKYLDFYKQTLENLYLYIKRKLDIVKYKSYNKEVTYYSPQIGYAKIMAVLNFRLAFFADLINEFIKFDDQENERSRIYNINQTYFSRRLYKQRYLKKVKNDQSNEKELSDLIAQNRLENLKEIEKNINNPVLNNTTPNEWYPAQYHYWKWINFFIPTIQADYGNSTDLKWLRSFGKGDSILSTLYIKEVLQFALSLKQKGLTTNEFETYKDLELIYLSLFRRTFPIDLSNTMLETSRLLLNFNPDLIDFYIKWTFKKTNVLNISHTIDTLNKLSKWFSEFRTMNKPLPTSFDHEYFCKGIDIIVNMDHLILHNHILNLFYEFNDIFEGKARKVIYKKLLMKKYFDLFFLHWDKTIRCSYHMVIIHTIKRNLRKNEGKISKSTTLIDSKIYNALDRCIKRLENMLSNNWESISNRYKIYGPISLEEYKTSLSNYNPSTVPETLKNMGKSMF